MRNKHALILSGMTAVLLGTGLIACNSSEENPEAKVGGGGSPQSQRNKKNNPSDKSGETDIWGDLFAKQRADGVTVIYSGEALSITDEFAHSCELIKITEDSGDDTGRRELRIFMWNNEQARPDAVAFFSLNIFGMPGNELDQLMKDGKDHVIEFNGMNQNTPVDAFTSNSAHLRWTAILGDPAIPTTRAASNLEPFSVTQDGRTISLPGVDVPTVCAFDFKQNVTEGRLQGSLACITAYRTVPNTFTTLYAPFTKEARQFYEPVQPIHKLSFNALIDCKLRDAVDHTDSTL